MDQVLRVRAVAGSAALGLDFDGLEELAERLRGLADEAALAFG